MSNKDTTPSQAEKTELICTKLLGWEKRGDFWYKDEKPVATANDIGIYCECGAGIDCAFDCFTNWRDTHTVLEALMEDKEMWSIFIGEFWSKGNGYAMAQYMKASKEELMDTIFSLLT